MTGLPWWLRQKRICLQCGRPGFNPWVWKIPWGRAWQPASVFLPEKAYRQRSLVGYGPCGHTGSDATEYTHTHTQRLNCLICVFLWATITKYHRLRSLQTAEILTEWKAGSSSSGWQRGWVRALLQVSERVSFLDPLWGSSGWSHHHNLTIPQSPTSYCYHLGY